MPALRKKTVLSTILLALALFPGCGATKSYTATEQLLMSDAVDATVAKLDFRYLANRKVYLDATYLKTVKSPLLIDSDYVISSLRQQMLAAGVLLVEGREEADIVAEARMGALGIDGHNIIFGVPASNALSSASSAIAGTPLLPPLPEISFARREAKSGAAKLAVFAYDRTSREPVWQSGVARSTSTAKDMWFLGIGPFQHGTIYDGTQFAGGDIMGEIAEKEPDPVRDSKSYAKYLSEQHYERLSDFGLHSIVTEDAEHSEVEEDQVDGEVVTASASSE